MLIVVFIVAIFLLAAYFYNAYFGSLPGAAFFGQPPSILITAPGIGTSIYSGNGIDLRAAANSENGVARIDFLVNGELQESFSASDPSQTSLAHAFVWYGSRAGQQVLSVTATDPDGRASSVASVTVTVLPLGTAQANGRPDNDPAQLAADGGLPMQAGDEFQAGPEAAGADQAAQDQAAQAGANAGDQADHAPSIDFFDYDLDLIQGGARITWLILASDDVGVARINFVTFLDGAVYFDLQFECDGQPQCELILPGGIEFGESLFSVQAVDSAGQVSEPELLFAEVVGDPQGLPAAAEHDGELGFPLGDIVADIDWDFGPLGVDIEDIFGQFAPAFGAGAGDEGQPDVDPSGALADIELNIALNSIVIAESVRPDRVSVEAEFPADFPWPQGERVLLLLESKWGSSPWQRNALGGPNIQVSDAMRGQPYVFEQVANVVCGSEEWALRLVLTVNGDDFEYGQPVSFTTPPCTPVSPLSLSVFAGSNADCPGDLDHCVILNWQLDPAPPAPEEASLGEFVIIKRLDRFGTESFVRLNDLNETQYIDLQPTWISEGRWCVPPASYSIRVYDSDWLGSQSLTVELPNLNCVDPWGFRGEATR